MSPIQKRNYAVELSYTHWNMFWIYEYLKKKNLAELLILGVVKVNSYYNNSSDLNLKCDFLDLHEMGLDRVFPPVFFTL